MTQSVSEVKQWSLWRSALAEHEHRERLEKASAREACCSTEADDRGAVEVRRVDALVGVPVICLAAGAGHCVAHTQTGEAWAWGRDEHGQCGLGDATMGRSTQVEAPRRLEVSSPIDRAACGRAACLPRGEAA